MKLHKYQIDHAQARLRVAAAKKVADRIGPEPDVPELSFEQKVRLIRSGSATLKPNSQLSSYTDLDDAYEYPDEKRDSAIVAKKAWTRAKAKAEAAEAAAIARIVDGLILSGDAAEALEMIESYVRASR